MEQFGIGQPVRRREDARFVTGAGRYTDDIDIAGQAHAVVLRSPHAHAHIRALATRAAEAAPGVLAVLTGRDAATDGLPLLPCQVDVPGAKGARMADPGRAVLQTDRVRYVGDPVAFVVAETPEQARDAAELVEVEYEVLPAVSTAAEAEASGAPVLHESVGSNLCVHWLSHDGSEAEAAFARAAKTVRVELANNRVVGNPMEPRVAIGQWEGEAEQYLLHSPTQGAVRVRNGLADIAFQVPKDRVRVVSPDVGGGFGLRGKLFPETIMVLWAARRLGRPVKWCADRQETMLADPHGRDHLTVAEMAFDDEGRILGMKAATLANLGGYLSDFGPRIPTVAGARIAGSVYHVPAMQLSVRCVFTNTVPTDAYRGAGRPEICYQMERLLDAGAEAFGLSTAEIRRRNFITPEALPYTNRVGMVIDSGAFADTQEQALERSDVSGFDKRRAESEAAGKRRGLGLGYYIEASGGAPAEQAQVRFEEDGRVSLIMGTFSHGQGHETAFAQIVHQKLGIALDNIQLLQGDTAFVTFGNGTGGSRSSQMGGVSVSRASAQIVEKASRIAAHRLEAAPADIEFSDATFRVAGTDLAITLSEVARIARDPAALPEGEEPGLDETCRYQRPTECNFPNGCHICEVEVDPDTGQVQVVKYTAVDDCGIVINPLLAAGQVHGGVGQGLGQALLEHTAYEAESGQFLAGSFMDYCMPRASDFPEIDVGFNPVPNPSNELGVKGIGEGGACGAPPAITAAVADALGISHIDMPITSEKVWRALNGG